MSEATEATNQVIGSDTTSDVDFAEKVFNEVEDISTSDDGGLDSWDDADSYEVKEQVNEEINDTSTDESSEDSVQDKSEDIKSEDQETKSEDVPSKEEAQDEASKDGVEDKQPSLEELLEKGDFEIDVKIDGQLQKVSLKELKSNYSGKVAFDKKFTELDKERTAWKQEVQAVNSYINEFAGKMRDGDVLGAFQYFGEFANIPSFMLKENLLHALGPEIERRMGMSAEQINAEYTQNHNEYLKKQNESYLQQKQVAQAQRERELAETSFREAQAIDAEVWQEAKEYLLSESEKQGFEVTPELVSTFIAQENAVKLADSLFTEFDVTSPSSEEMETLKNIIIQNPSFTKEDLDAVMSQAYGSKKEESIKKDLKKRVEKHEVKKTVQKKPEFTGILNEYGEEITDFDDLL